MRKFLSVLSLIALPLIQIENANAATSGPYPYSQLKDCDVMVIDGMNFRQFQDILDNSPNTNGGEFKVCLAGERGHVAGGVAPDLTQITITRDNTTITGEPARTAYDNKNSIVTGNYPNAATSGSVLVARNVKNLSLQSLHIRSDKPVSAAINLSEGTNVNTFDDMTVGIEGKGGKALGLYGTKEKPVKVKKISNFWIEISSAIPANSEILHGVQIYDSVVDEISKVFVTQSSSTGIGIQLYQSTVGSMKTVETGRLKGAAIEAIGSTIQLIDSSKLRGELGINLMKSAARPSRLGIIQNTSLEASKFGLLVQHGSMLSAANALSVIGTDNAAFGVALSGASSIGSLDYLKFADMYGNSSKGTALMVIENSKIGTVSNFIFNNKLSAIPSILLHSGTIETLYNGLITFAGAKAISENTAGSVKESINVAQVAS